MRLRLKFILLVATLLLFVLGGSFWLIFGDLHQEFLKGFRQDLNTSVEAFRSGEEQRFRTLATVAGFLEGSPAFRSVLRRSDENTVHEYLVDVSAPTDADVVLITDADGILLNRSDKAGAKGDSFAESPVIRQALQGAYAEGYWSDGEALFQVVSIPLVDSEYVDGSLTLGTKIDQAFLLQLSKELGVEIAYIGKPVIQPTTSFDTTARLMTDEVKLAADKKLILGKSLTPVTQFVRRSQWKLAQLGLAALLIALLVSVPLIGRMTNPVELLEMAQAEMSTIFRTNLDGLVFADEHGVITTCNPAATVALGYEEKELIGQSLVSKLPNEVLAQLDDAVGGTQSATYTRQGHDFKLYRTFVRREATETLGSILLFHDITAERERERLFHEFLADLDNSTSETETLAFQIGIKNLKTWSALKSEELPRNERALLLGSVVQTLRKDFSINQRWKSEDPPDGSVWADEELFLLVLKNLSLICLQRFDGETSLRIERDGGAFTFILQGALPESTPPLGDQSLRLEEPFHSELGTQALGLFLASRILERHHSRLSFSSIDGRESVSFSLPKAVEDEACS
jgi:PAS domain S-box-containing protein